MLTSITLGGHLGKKFGRDWKLDLDRPSPAEAVRALCAVCKGFRQWVLEHARPGYHVFAGERNLGAEQLGEPTGGGTIHIIPVLAGAVDKSVWQIIAGGVLIAAGVVAYAAGWVTGGLSTVLANSALGLGLSLVAGGVSQLLAGLPPPAETESGGPASYLYSGPANSSGVGGSVPVLYGELEIGGRIISAGIRERSIVANPIPYDDADPNPPPVRWHNPRPLNP